MALVDATLKNAIKAFMDDVSENKTTDTAAQQLADAISAYVRSASVSVTVTGTSATGGPVTGTGTGSLS